MPFYVPSYATLLKQLDALKDNYLKARQVQSISLPTLIAKGNLALAIEIAKREQTEDENHDLMFQLASLLRELTCPSVEQTYRSEQHFRLLEKISYLVNYGPVKLEQLKELYQTIPATSEYYEKSQKQIAVIQERINFSSKSNDLAEELTEKDQERTACPLGL
ncbi:hypothetical protein B1207_00775 [Legionella quinlivanii]|uniref:Uncharacterized protein n=1 Tax=Legionella quinlivanii TaxID=45073 RepID=A0A364LN33_9GAMM|nr:hypothetical protein [Legionella quinlivanii]RAP38456.1 hypothetical protein B1207_00775 [Legionella quinlivanii]